MKKSKYRKRMIFIYQRARMTIFICLCGSLLFFSSTCISKLNAKRCSNQIERVKDENASLTKELSNISENILEFESIISHNQEKTDQYKEVVIPDGMQTSEKELGGSQN